MKPGKSRFIILLFILFFAGCKEPAARKFNHSATLFPLNGAHMGVSCRECHKDGSLTSLPSDCQSCHPMSMAHTLNLGDCNLCHSTVTFSAPFFNHSRFGLSIKGAHIAMIVENCQGQCHIPGTYSGINFNCSRCHTNQIIDGRVHLSPNDNCEQCHTQAAFSPAAFLEHKSYITPTTGAHAILACSECHNSRFSNWLDINYRDGQIYGSCANCHTRNYSTGEDGHRGLPADANCGACHSTSTFDH